MFNWAWLVSILWIGLLRGCVEQAGRQAGIAGMCVYVEVCVYVPSAQV